MLDAFVKMFESLRGAASVYNARRAIAGVLCF